MMLISEAAIFSRRENEYPPRAIVPIQRFDPLVMKKKFRGRVIEMKMEKLPKPSTRNDENWRNENHASPVLHGPAGISDWSQLDTLVVSYLSADPATFFIIDKSTLYTCYHGGSIACTTKYVYLSYEVYCIVRSNIVYVKYVECARTEKLMLK